MEIVLWLGVISVLFIVVIGGFLYWSIMGGQFEDLDENAHSILEDDDNNPD